MALSLAEAEVDPPSRGSGNFCGSGASVHRGRPSVKLSCVMVRA